MKVSPHRSPRPFKMKFSQSALLIGSATFAAFADAAHMPLSGHTTPRATLARRSNLSGTSGLTFNGNGIDVEYLTNITLAGKQYTVLVDTGRSVLFPCPWPVAHTMSLQC